MMPITGSATSSRKRTATLTSARSPLRQTMVGLPLSPMVSTRKISARPSPRRTRGVSGTLTVSPHARRRWRRAGDTRQKSRRIAAAGQLALVNPPDFIGEPFE